MKIIVTSEDELKEIAATLLHLSLNLRHWTIKWNENHGSEYLRAKKKWEKMMDDYLEGLQATKTHHPKEVHISIKSDQENS